MHPSSSKRSATAARSRCASSRVLAARNSSIRRSSTRLTGVVSTLAILLFTFTLIPSTSAKCCINIDSRSDANAPQSFSVKVSGRATTFFPNNKKYDIQAVFPTNYALQPPKPVLPLTKPNCTQYVAPPTTIQTGFGALIVPPPINPDTPQPKPEFLEFWVNGDMKCDQETSVDNCPDPATGKPTNATSSAAGRPAALMGSSEGGSMGKWIGFVSLALAVAGGLFV
ncbi:hypothetical protein BCR44DRAFT_1464056 [Catenaria anguillulae PL171]|uniref:Uncharacterized protein n=1 Tax=Catenaria anguillulae PL171 TaxID=765915 RepID=A0A1Y2HB50_9FUNG|nr:hypothetical protein BCR44DRAFT_1464056 [Catenaria anguillulae PL171]